MAAAVGLPLPSYRIFRASAVNVRPPDPLRSPLNAWSWKVMNALRKATTLGLAGSLRIPDIKSLKRDLTCPDPAQQRVLRRLAYCIS